MWTKIRRCVLDFFKKVLNTLGLSQEQIDELPPNWKARFLLRKNPKSSGLPLLCSNTETHRSRRKLSANKKAFPRILRERSFLSSKL